jgi:hypothetical protein
MTQVPSIHPVFLLATIILSYFAPFFVKGNLSEVFCPNFLLKEKFDRYLFGYCFQNFFVLIQKCGTIRTRLGTCLREMQGDLLQKVHPHRVQMIKLLVCSNWFATSYWILSSTDYFLHSVRLRVYLHKKFNYGPTMNYGNQFNKDCRL